MGDPSNVSGDVVVTAAQAAAAVKRTVPVVKGGNPTGETKEVSVAAEEVLGFAVRGDQVSVVTTDGKRLRGTLGGKK